MKKHHPVLRPVLCWVGLSLHNQVHMEEDVIIIQGQHTANQEQKKKRKYTVQSTKVHPLRDRLGKKIPILTEF